MNDAQYDPKDELARFGRDLVQALSTMNKVYIQNMTVVYHRLAEVMKQVAQPEPDPSGSMDADGDFLMAAGQEAVDEFTEVQLGRWTFVSTTEHGVEGREGRSLFTFRMPMGGGDWVQGTYRDTLEHAMMDALVNLGSGLFESTEDDDLSDRLMRAIGYPIAGGVEILTDADADRELKKAVWVGGFNHGGEVTGLSAHLRERGYVLVRAETL